MKNKKTIKLALIGFGWVTREIWLPIFESNSIFNVIAIFDVDNIDIKNVQKKYPRLKVCGNALDIVSMNPDLVLIATPNKFHIKYAELFLNKNISVMVEKPICLNLTEYERLKKAAINSSAIFIPSAANKFRNDVLAMGKLLSNDKFGKIYSMNLEWIRASGIPKPGSWFTNKTFAGGGAGYDLGWHILDVGLSLLKYPDICSATGIGFSNFLNKNLNDIAKWRNDPDISKKLSIDVEDQFIGFIKTSNNVAIALKTAWASHETIDSTKITVNCEKATIELLTTFGFSPYRIKEPCLKILQNGRARILKFKNLKIGAEYESCVNNLATMLKDKKISYENIKNIHPVVKSLDLIYQSF
jgi:oxidoreductase